MNKRNIILTLSLTIAGGFLLVAISFIKHCRDTRGRAIPKMKRVEMDVNYTLDWEQTLWAKTIPEKAKPYLFYPLTKLPMNNDFVGKISYIRLHNPKLKPYQLKIIPNLLGHSYDITLLNMNNSNINDDSIISLDHFPNLSTATFKNCPISDKGLGKIPALLKGICLENTDIKGSFLCETENGSIEYLNLNKCNFNKNAMVDLKNFKNLKTIELCNAGIDGKCMQYIGELSQLEILKLAGNNINDQDFLMIGNLTRLVHLDLSHTGITDKGICHLIKMDRLSQLKLCGTAVTGVCLKQMVSLKSLRWLDLRGTKIKQKEIDRLSEMKPELTIFADNKK